MVKNLLQEPKIRPPKKIKFDELSKAYDNLGLPPLHYNKFREDINKAINEFNSAKDSSTKKAALIKMQQAIDYVDLYTPPNILVKAKKFHTVKGDLFTQIKKAFTENNVNTMLKVGSADIPIAHILSDMSPKKADKLMSILHKDMPSQKNRIQQDLIELYDPKDISVEANQWREFLNKHSIEFLGGANSRNYKIINIDPTDPNYGNAKVLKIDNRLEMPRNVEQHLRDALGDVFIPIYAARQVRGTDDKGALASRTLLVTDLCTSGSANEHSKKIREKGQEETFRECSDIMRQMAQVFMDIQKANCCFPDSKLTNWLVDGNGKIRLADTKSFVFTSKNGIYSHTIPGNEHVWVMRTPGFRPQEINNQINNPSFNAKQLHSSLLGRNIYTYLTGDWPDKIDLNKPIFQTDIGKEYKRLIEQLIQDPPDSRMSMKDADNKLQQLSLLSNSEYKKICDRARNLSLDLKISLRSLVDKSIETDKKTGISQSDTLAKISDSLDKLEESVNQCAQKMQQISAIKVNSQPVITIENLARERYLAVLGATSINDLKFKLDKFSSNVEQNQVKLTEYKKISEKCDELINKINSSKFSDNKYITSLPPLQREKPVTNSITSIDVLKGKMQRFTENLQKHLAIADKLSEYEMLQKSLNALKVGKNDKEMDKFLDACNKAVTKNTNIDEQLKNITTQVNKMQRILTGLNSPENQEIKAIIDKFDKKSSWHTIGMHRKARKIEFALANVPIEERAQLLQSKDARITSVFEAIASHRISFFTQTKNDKGQIKEANAATSFKEFKTKFKDPMTQREDVECEKEKDTAPKFK
ncbi:MAG: hypothetical protein QM652_05695 [Legionella sp.]|uniref:hypothetical protein n=1 Tax=Legionella sp. TaxID=459 RepID=UPI0039E69D9C